MNRRLVSMAAIATVATVASAASLLVACSSATASDPESHPALDAGSAEVLSAHDGAVPVDSSPAEDATAEGDSGANAASGFPDSAAGVGCRPADGTYTVTYTETMSAGTGCQETDGGPLVTSETFPVPSDAGADDEGGLTAGCTCTGVTLTCTFASTLRGTSTSTTTLSETFTDGGWTGTVSHEVNALDGGVLYLCAQAVSAKKD